MIGRPRVRSIESRRGLSECFAPVRKECIRSRKINGLVKDLAETFACYLNSLGGLRYLRSLHHRVSHPPDLRLGILVAGRFPYWNPDARLATVEQTAIPSLVPPTNAEATWAERLPAAPREENLIALPRGIAVIHPGGALLQVCRMPSHSRRSHCRFRKYIRQTHGRWKLLVLPDVLRRLPGHKINQIDELLPANWKPPTSALAAGHS
jgi:hypothetical protein